MKRILYPFVSIGKQVFTFFIASIFVCGIAEAQSYSAYGPSDVPANPNDIDPSGAIETGVRFTVTQAGQITGIRFYKGTLNTGTHVGHLWSSTGSLLATATFTGETASGWQSVNFGSPVSVTIGVVYIASVHSPTGRYASTENYFEGEYKNNSIRLLADGEQGVGNGLYSFSATPLAAPPAQTFNATNYWIDVLFDPFFPLPVQLSELKASSSNQEVLVSWKTSTETNNKGFEVQRSNNGSDWYTIGFVGGAGESEITKSYSYSDKGLAPGAYYYRLNQVDFDGKSKTSNVVTANVGGRGVASLHQNFPNPFVKTTTIRFDLPVTQKIRLSVVDLSGREVKVLANKQVEQGTHQVTLDAAGLSRQTYIIRLQTETGTLTRKIILE